MDRTFIFLARILWMCISVLCFAGLLTTFLWSVNILLYGWSHEKVYLPVETRETVSFTLFVAFACACVVAEAAAVFSQRAARSRLLTGLRFGPLTAICIFVAGAIASDQTNILVSRHNIRAYVYQNSAALARPEIYLHNDYRGWCGNGHSARENNLYFETASQGMHDRDPFVRARALMISYEVQDMLNGGDQRFDEYLLAACGDESPVVRGVARTLSSYRISCDRLPPVME